MAVQAAVAAIVLVMAGCSSPGAGTSPSPTGSPLLSVTLERAFPNLTFERPVGMVTAPDIDGRIFVVEKEGSIMAFPNSDLAASAEVFLDITDRVNSDGSEEGLLGIAFDPDYGNNSYFYVSYTASAPRRSVVSRFSTRQAETTKGDPGSEFILMEVEQPYANHNGGHIEFGPDGYLYIGLGDGGAAGDPHGNGQDLSTLLGTILRIDVHSTGSGMTYGIPADNPFVGLTDGAREEIWAYGLRNPWRFSFDADTGTLWAGDVGQNRYEEIDIIRAGGNYGWNVMEGNHCFEPPEGCSTAGLTAPLVEYTHDDGCSVTGGLVYLGSRSPSMYGVYLYGDYCSGKVWGLRYEDSVVTDHAELLESDLSIVSFGEDIDGEVYVISLDGGIYRLTAE